MIRQMGRMLTLLALLSLSACGLGGSNPNEPPGREPLFLSVDDDKALGAQVAQQIASDPAQFPLLDPADYPEAYAYLRQMVRTIQQSGQLRHANDFDWTIWIVNRPDVQNAFCIPGGHMYVYTGLIHTLDRDDELAGVLGHEMAHADLRHTSRSLEQAYGMQLLIQLILGEESVATDIGQQLAHLGFSRSHEREADLASVHYLCNTPYEADGAAGFFLKMTQAGEGQSLPAILSTHPNPGDRVEAIRQRAQQLGCDTPPGTDTYARFKASLP